MNINLRLALVKTPGVLDGAIPLSNVWMALLVECPCLTPLSWPGPLHSVAVLLGRNGPQPDSIRVALHATDPGGGPGEMLAHSFLSGVELPDRMTPGFLEAGFVGAGLSLEVGVSYGIFKRVRVEQETP